MSLSTIVQRGVKRAFDASGDLVIPVSIVTTTTVYDPNTGVSTPASTTALTRGVIVEDDSSYMNLTSVPKHSLTLLVDADTYNGDIGSKVEINSVLYTVVSSQPIYVGATAVAIILWAETI